MNKSSHMLVYINGQFLPEEQASLQISDLSIQRGYGIFDFFRTKDHVPLFIDDYLDRFYNSASGLRLDVALTRDELKKVIHQLMNKNNLKESGIRILLTGGYSSDSYTPGKPNLVIIEQPLVLPSKEDFLKGINIITHEYQRDLPGIKSINYLVAVWLQSKMQELQASDIVYHKNGIVSEMPRANIFIVDQQGNIITPSRNMLCGITRKKLISIIKNDYGFQERDLRVDELITAKEVFMTNTTRRIFPIVKIDGNIISDGKPGKITISLRDRFLELEQKYFEKYADLSASNTRTIKIHN